MVHCHMIHAATNSPESVLFIYNEFRSNELLEARLETYHFTAFNRLHSSLVPVSKLGLFRLDN